MPLRPPGRALQSRLLRLHALSPEYGRGLSSHLPMALAALDAMGASEAQLDHFETRYRAGHALQADGLQGSPIRDWPTLLGQHDALPELRASLHAELAQAGVQGLLARALPHLLECPGAVAFHGLIRSAHALESGVLPELVEALAYWGSRWQPLPPAPAPAEPPIDSPADWLDALDASWRASTPDWVSDGPLIAHRMRSAARLPAWQRGAGRLQIEATGPLLTGLARAAAQRYLRTRQFTVLHMLTGVRAAAVLHAQLPLDAASVGRLRDAVAAASLVSGLARTPAAPEPTLPPANWPELLAQACAHEDEHVIKLVHALAWWDARAPDALWARTACRALAA